MQENTNEAKAELPHSSSALTSDCVSSDYPAVESRRSKTEPLPFCVLALYSFLSLRKEQLANIKGDLERLASAKGIRGLIVLSSEGFNLTIAGSPSGVKEVREFLRHHGAQEEAEEKISWAQQMPFRRFKVDIRPELVTSWPGSPRGEEVASKNAGTYLSPAEWEARLERAQLESNDQSSSRQKGGTAPAVVIDTRNDYEWRIGTFRGAITPDIKHFSDFPAKIAELDVPRESEVLLFCTGGIRCEKAVSAFKEAGYQKVYQLHGGILKYLEELPNRSFEGECFVFDHRVAVQQDLSPSERFTLCPHCGDPAEKRPESTITCNYCNKEQIVCSSCLEDSIKGKSCSKGCAWLVSEGKSKR